MVEFLEFFSESSFSLNRVDNRQRTALHNACCHGDLGVIEGLVKSGAELDLLDKDECTALCIAIRECQTEAAKLLIQAGANINIGGGIYGSPLHLAIVRSDV